MNIKTIPLLLFVLILIGCGNSKEDQKEEKDTIKINKTTEDENVEEEGVTKVLLTGNDQMRYNLEEIRVDAGDKVILTLKHVGKLGVEVMGHNFVLLEPNTVLNDFAIKAVDAKANDYIPENSDKVIVHTKMIGGGEQTTIEFDAPEKGTYDFICSFPGHVALMQGKFIVE